jgi:hypothetical protein
MRSIPTNRLLLTALVRSFSHEHDHDDARLSNA